mgnify:CR=1 FL=1
MLMPPSPVLDVEKSLARAVDVRASAVELLSSKAGDRVTVAGAPLFTGTTQVYESDAEPDSKSAP